MPRTDPAAVAAADPEPPRDCPICPRLVAYRAENRAAHPDWWNGPAPSFGDPNARLLVVGLAPGRTGANRTGRPFTGDYAGVLLYETLLKTGFARGRYEARPDDGLHARRLHDHQRGPLRAARQQAGDRRGGELPPVPRRPHRRAAAPEGDRDAGRRRAPQRAARARPQGLRRRWRPRRPLRRRPLRPDQQLPLLKAEHEHGPARRPRCSRLCSKRRRGCWTAPIRRR